MPATISTERVDVKDTIKALRRIDPEAAKEFRRGVRDVLKPLVAEMKAGYPSMPLSGMKYEWTPKSYAIFPWDLAQAKKNIKVKTSTRRDKNSVVYITQAYPAGVIFEAIQPGNTPLGARLRAKHRPVMWPAADRMAPSITQGIGELVQKAEQTVQKELW